ncbi:MAG: hypothetical protein HY829_10505 [Actinobacteria bacterium]|nr:hypothetical protein [Actinomycetota bacterium]
MWTLVFWRAVADRALKTAAQAALLVAGSDSLRANALTFDWLKMGGFALGGIVLSVLMSIASAASTDGSPSLTGAEILTPPVVPQRALPAEPSVTANANGTVTSVAADGTTTLS